MSAPEPAFEELLAHLKDSRGFDFTGYKRTSLTRRVEHRMGRLGMSGFSDYLDFLQLHPDEFTALFNTILINVTGFFRDPDVWGHLREELLPALVAARAPGEPIRVWSAGCASGEEAYTLAMVLTEIMGAAQVRSRVKIYATDVDEEGLAQARQGTYSAREVRGVPPELLGRYFEQAGERYVFRKDLRRSVIFGRNDLVQDAPISRIDLLVCRNTLMYFNAETQARILRRFHFALAPKGVLFVGKAEMLLARGAQFEPIDLKRRVFAKVAQERAPDADLLPELPPVHPRADPSGLELLRTESLLAGPLAQVVLTTDGLVALVSRRAEALYGVSERDVGHSFRDLELSYRPVELRRHIEQAQAERRAVRVPDVRCERGGEERVVEVEVLPLAGGDAALLGVAVVFHDVTENRRLGDELEQVNRRLETAHEELQSTNEELETTNEELHSTVEELETTNEELQSTNEELETMNEELQSTNDELQGLNDELQRRTAELDTSNEFLEAILAGLRQGVAVLGPELTVRAWNRQAQELWGLRREEAMGEHFLNLDIGLPTDRLRPVIRRALSGEGGPHELVVDAVNRRGRGIVVRVLGTTLDGAGSRGAGVILMMEEVGRAGASAAL
ncbi:MAG TPA: CheR family methyltransferase [Pseudonocardia sp.]|nr:CheR family methyltransferase [Pseudonocardia sp.]